MLAWAPSRAGELHTDGARMRPDLRPMLATLTDKPFDDPAWVFETKWDGFRAIAVAAPGHATLYSRNGNDISRKYPSICSAPRRDQAGGRARRRACGAGSRRGVRASSCCRTPSGSRRGSSIACSICSISTARICAARPLLERKAELERILPKSPLLLYSAHVVGNGIKAFNKAKRAQEEGVMAKLASGRYHSGVRTREWLKVKASQEQEVVIVGFTAPRRSRKYFGALLLAVREGKGWAYVGRAGTGFDAEALRSLHAMMLPLVTETKPVPQKVPDVGITTWVRPKLVAEVKFTEWTEAGEMRHPVFLGMQDRQEGDGGDPGIAETLARCQAQARSKRR